MILMVFMARHILRRLGFTAGRRLDGTLGSPPARHRLANDGTEALTLHRRTYLTTASATIGCSRRPAPAPLA